ncbi:MAG TPA: nucleotidyltransferase domain-containing protein [Candidatus Nanoarchaeia archaeon]|nr:nucleotidyltransferase domain-containing protein [Candidatus Nanoarchaeia archaeon]
MDGKTTIQEELASFKHKLVKDMPLKKMILFGSRAQGKTGRDTDVDLIIVSEAFSDLDFFQRGVKMYRYWDLSYPVDFLCYTPIEFDQLKQRLSIVHEAVREGIEI